MGKMYQVEIELFTKKQRIKQEVGIEWFFTYDNQVKNVMHPVVRLISESIIDVLSKIKQDEIKKITIEANFTE